MKYIPAGTSRLISRALLHGRKASPTLLFAAGVVGVGASTVLACKSTLRLEDTLAQTQDHISKAKKLIAEQREDYTQQDYQRDMAIIYMRAGVAVCKLYAPSIIVGSLAIASLTGSHHILNRRYAALSAAYATVVESLDEYRKRVIAEVGEEKERELRYPLEPCEIDVEDEKGKLVSKTVMKVGERSVSMYARFFDSSSSSWSPLPEYNVVFLRSQQNYLNDRLKAKGHVFLNEVYDALGIERTPAGAVVGWLWKGDGDNYIDFGIFNREMQPQHYDFFTGRENAVLLDFNVDGEIWKRI